MFSTIDHSIFFFLDRTIANPVCDGLIRFFMQVPGQFCIVFMGAAAFFFGKKYLKVSSLIFLSAFTISRYLYQSIKFFVKRPRPFHFLEDVRLFMGPRDGFSFPSGHATTSFCIAVVIAMRYPKARFPVLIAAFLVAISRPYMGVHYPSDILAGAILGSFIGYYVTKTAKKCIEE